MTAVADLHTHRLDSTDGIISVNPFFNAYDAAKHYSAGIHPWNAESAAEREINALYEAAARGEVVAIGECGLDRLRGGCLDYQIKIFREHIIERGAEKAAYCALCAVYCRIACRA